MIQSVLKDVVRRTSTSEDEVLLRRIYATTRQDEMAMVDWSDEQKDAFLDMQFRAQDTYYRSQFPDAKYDILERGGEPIGRLYTEIRVDELRILDLAILPEFRNGGLGTALIEGLKVEAAEAGVWVTLHVECFNRALHLYERLGFRQLQVDGIYILMTSAPAESASPS